MKIYLGIGMGQVNPEDYGGWNGKLNGTIPDVKLFEKRLKESYKFDSINVLLNEQATWLNVKKQLESLAATLKSGDLLTICYSGHGGQMWDISGDEPDDFDETWCLWDGQVIDDLIYEQLLKFKKGVKIFIFSDSCHSGTVYKSRILVPSNKKSIIVPKLKCTLKHFGGCQDEQYSMDLGSNGLFTKTIWEIVDNNPKITPKQLAAELKKVMPEDQQPSYVNSGPQNLKWDLTPIFN